MENVFDFRGAGFRLSFGRVSRGMLPLYGEEIGPRCPFNYGSIDHTL